PTWDQPAAPCLASRLPYGLAVTRERLAMVERAEDNLRALGLREFRVRHHGDVARLELIPQDLERAVTDAGAWAEAVLAAGFSRVLLDVHGYRRGALNEVLPLVHLARAWASLRAAVPPTRRRVGATNARITPERRTGSISAGMATMPWCAHVRYSQPAASTSMSTVRATRETCSLSRHRPVASTLSAPVRRRCASSGSDT